MRFEAQCLYTAKIENACYLPNKEVMKLSELKLLSSTKWSEACVLLQAVDCIHMQHSFILHSHLLNTLAQFGDLIALQTFPVSSSACRHHCCRAPLLCLFNKRISTVTSLWKCDITREMLNTNTYIYVIPI